MKLERWALIAEIVGSFAVVVTLIFLLVEVRENTVAIQATNQQSIAARVEERMLTMATSPQLSRLMNLVDEPGGIERDSTEWLQLVFVYHALLTAAEEAYLQYRQGFLEEDYFFARANRALGPLDNPVGRDTYRGARATGQYVAEYMDWIDDTYGYGSKAVVGDQPTE